MKIEEIVNIITPNISYDANQDYYYDTISAFQKSIRGSDVNAALLYLAILIEAQDLDVIIRRLNVIAYEDIGIAAPETVIQVNNALTCALQVGFPEARIPLAYCVVLLALSPKSNAAYLGLDKASAYIKNNTIKIPEYLRSSTSFLEKEDYHNIPYQYKHLIKYLPSNLKDKDFLELKDKGSYEKKLYQIDQYLKKINRSHDLKELKKQIKRKEHLSE
ncbi:MAG: replication-associated recombination protein A, partial [Bacilli bacterium]